MKFFGKVGWMRIIVTNEQNFVAVDEQKIREAIGSLPEAEKKYKLSVVYVVDAEIAKMNERYLKHEGPTDVLAFPMSAKEGEIIVSGETALREATERKIEPQGELLLYTVHGTLHLLGFDDKSEEEAKKMHEIEKSVITKMGYTWNWDE